MHEMSLAEGVLQLIEDAARRDRFSKVSTVWLEIGELSGVEPEALAFCFDAVTRNTVAAGARLEIVTLHGQGWCEAWRLDRAHGRGLRRLPELRWLSAASNRRHRNAGEGT